MSLPNWLNAAAVAGSALWAIALYWGWSPLADRLLTALEGWLGADSPGASLLGISPFLALGSLVYCALVISLGASWAVSLGVIAAIGCGVYELGRRDGQASD